MIALFVGFGIMKSWQASTWDSKGENTSFRGSRIGLASVVSAWKDGFLSNSIRDEIATCL